MTSPAKKGAVLLALALVTILAVPAGAADQLQPERQRVRDAEARIASLQNRLSRLMAEMNSVSAELSTAYGGLGISNVRLQRAQRQAEETRRTLTLRAREAYKRGAWTRIGPLADLKSTDDLETFSKYVGAAFKTDSAVYQSHLQAVESIKQERLTIDEQKQQLVTAAARIEPLRNEIQKTLESEQQELAGARAELARLEAQRRRSIEAERRRQLEISRRGVSPVVEARRAARQIELDRKLAARLAWMEPATGTDGSQHPRLQPSGIVTNGATSWYGPGFDGKRASSGATYDVRQYTAASLVLPFGTFLKVSHGGRSVIVVITDRGPYVAGRVLDLSAAAAQAIGVSGVKQVRMEIMLPKEPAPPFP